MEVSFDVPGLSAKRKTGHAYRVTATDEGVSFVCLTIDDKGKRPTVEKREALSFVIGWNDINEVCKPSSMFDRMVRFTTKDGQKTDCVFENDGEEELAYRQLKEAFDGKVATTFRHEQTPKWKLMVLPVGYMVLMIVIGFVAFLWFDHLEQEGGRIRTHFLIILIYETLGKYGVLALFLLASLAGVFGIIKKLRLYNSLADRNGQA